MTWRRLLMARGWPFPRIGQPPASSIIDRPFARIEGIGPAMSPPPKDNGRRRSSPDEELRRALNGCEVLFEMGEVLHV